MKNKFEQRLKELERKSKYYDLATVRVISDNGMEKELEDVWISHEFEELKKKVGTSKNAHKKIIGVLFLSFVLLFAEALFFYRRNE